MPKGGFIYFWISLRQVFAFFIYFGEVYVDISKKASKNLGIRLESKSPSDHNNIIHADRSNYHPLFRTDDNQMIIIIYIQQGTTSKRRRVDSNVADTLKLEVKLNSSVLESGSTPKNTKSINDLPPEVISNFIIRV